MRLGKLSAAKLGIVGLSKWIALDLQPFNVHSQRDCAVRLEAHDRFDRNQRAETTETR